MDTLPLAVLHSKDHVALYSIITPFCYKPQLKPHIISVNSKRQMQPSNLVFLSDVFIFQRENRLFQASTNITLSTR